MELLATQFTSQQQVRPDIFRVYVRAGQRSRDLAFFHDVASLGYGHDGIQILLDEDDPRAEFLVRNDFSASQMCCTINGCTPSDGSSRIIRVEGGLPEFAAPR
jgi:hypothetical protein